MRDELVRIEITDVTGVFLVRQAGRRVAAALHLAPHDQVRVATAVSEFGRELFTRHGEVSAAFLLDRDGEPALVIEFGFGARPGTDGRPGADGPLESTSAAARLMDLVEVDGTGEHLLVRARKRLPAGTVRITGAELDELRTRLWRLHSVSALEELRAQNAELIEAVEDARRQREELQRLNAELEKTNQGVMALYTELSEELETTNRGVVALYAELDEKTDQLREAGEAKNRFWASISHELRTPVNAIIGLARLLLDPGADPLHGEQRKQISLINDTGVTLLALVNELLDMAKAEQGRLEPQPSAVDTHALLNQLSAVLAPMAEPTGLTLTVDAAGAPPVLVTDEVMLTRLLRNLLGNGLKFTDEGEVRLTVRSTPQHVEFVVTDTGRGIPRADLERVFEEFYQVSGFRTEGTGLGLPYARRLALLLGGDLQLDSVLGEGTTVTLRLPPHGPLAELALGHVLIADGDAATRRSLHGLFEYAAERVSEAPDVPSALRLAASDPPGLVLLDPDLPGHDGQDDRDDRDGQDDRDGHDVLAAVPRDTIVLVLTAADTATSGRPKPERADAVLSKNQLDPAILKETVQQVRERRAREDR